MKHTVNHICNDDFRCSMVCSDGTSHAHRSKQEVLLSRVSVFEMQTALGFIHTHSNMPQHESPGALWDRYWRCPR